MRAISIIKSDRVGSMLLEVLFTMMILFIALLALASMLITVIQNNSSSAQLTRAAAVGQDRMEALKLRPYTTLTSGMADNGVSPDVTAGDGTFTARDTVDGITRTWTVREISAGLSEITVTLTWTDRLGKPRQQALRTLRAS